MWFLMVFWVTLVNFFGEHCKSLDDKGRVSIPREYRDLLAQADGAAELVVTKNMDGGLTVYPAAEWAEFVKRLEQCADPKQRTALNRLYLAPKTEVRLDRQGRMPLSRAQRMWAGIADDAREIMVVGNFARIDLFSPDRYREVVGNDVELLRGEAGLINRLDLP
jgi:transcriptional regulator MraZ